MATALPQASSPDANLTIAQAVGGGLLVKSKSLWYNTAVAAGATVQVPFPTYDDNLLRILLGLWADLTTAGVFYQLQTSGRTMSDQDGAGFSATKGPLGVYVPVAPHVVTNLQIVNNTGGNVTPTGFTLYYGVDDPNWTIGA